MSKFVGYDASMATNYSCAECGYEWKDESATECPRCAATLVDASAQDALFEIPAETCSRGAYADGSTQDVRVVPPSSGDERTDESSSDDEIGWDDVAAVAVSEPDAEQLGFEIADVKPPYRIPLMSEIEKIEDSGLRIASTFSGCGGSCLGFRMAGYRTLWASEFIPAAGDTYEANHPGVPLDRRDIRLVKPEEILEITGLDVGELDVFEGSPPCASFSMAGKREKAWGEVKKYSDTEQRVDDLFDEYIRLVRGLQPKVFVAENVPGLVVGKAVGYFKHVFRELEASGYRVAARVLDAQWLGVPQRRKRLIFVGVRRDLGRAPVFPEPLTYRYSIREALPWLDGKLEYPSPPFGGRPESGMNVRRTRTLDEPAPAIRSDQHGDQALLLVPEARLVVDQTTSTHSDKDVFEHSLDDPIPTITTNGIGSDWKGDWMIEQMHPARVEIDPDEPAPTIIGNAGGGVQAGPQFWLRPTEDEIAETSIERYAIGREWEKLGPGEQSDKYLNLIKPDADAPCPTVTQTGGNIGAASVTHPTEKRKFTIPELRRLSGFPDDFVLTGSWGQQWERIGRAVPPPMMRAVAATIRREIFDR